MGSMGDSDAEKGGLLSLTYASPPPGDTGNQYHNHRLIITLTATLGSSHLINFSHNGVFHTDFITVTM